MASKLDPKEYVAGAAAAIGILIAIYGSFTARERMVRMETILEDMKKDVDRLVVLHTTDVVRRMYPDANYARDFIGFPEAAKLSPEQRDLALRMLRLDSGDGGTASN